MVEVGLLRATINAFFDAAEKVKDTECLIDAKERIRKFCCSLYGRGENNYDTFLRNNDLANMRNFLLRADCLTRIAVEGYDYKVNGIGLPINCSPITDKQLSDIMLEIFRIPSQGDQSSDLFSTTLVENGFAAKYLLLSGEITEEGHFNPTSFLSILPDKLRKKQLEVESEKSKRLESKLVKSKDDNQVSEEEEETIKFWDAMEGPSKAEIANLKTALEQAQQLSSRYKREKDELSLTNQKLETEIGKLKANMGILQKKCDRLENNNAQNPKRKMPSGTVVDNSAIDPGPETISNLQQNGAFKGPNNL